LKVAWSAPWQLRPVTPADEPLLRRIYAGTRQAELALTRWEQAERERFLDLQFRAQARHYQAAYPGAEHSVIEVDADGAGWQPAGRLWLNGREQTLHVLDIALLPAFCGRGLGTRVLGRVLQQAGQAGRAASIYVEFGNPARRLYERLGFVAQGPVQGVHQRMAWQGLQQLAGQV
jgi:GNAT superfamily N-acetyltransferase